MTIENGFPIPAPTPNDRGPRDADQTYRLPEAIAKPIVHGSLDDRGRGTAMPHATMAGKVMPTARAAPPANEIQAPAITSGATSKPSWPPGRGKMRP
jgi:hypothetical protein